MAAATLFACPPRAVFWSGAAAIYALSALLLRALPGFDRPERVAMAIVFDLTVSVTLLAWFVQVRTGRWPATALAPVFFVGVAATRALAPPEASGVVSWIAAVAITGEIVLVGWIALRARRGLAAARAVGDAEDRLGRLRAAARAAVRHRGAAEAIAFELAVLAYALGRTRAPHVPPGATAFDYRRRTPYGPVVAALGLVVLAETAPLHFVIARWSDRAAWVLTALGLYTLLYLVADWRATRERPILLDAERLVVRTGIRWTVEIPRVGIAAVERRPFADGEKPLRAALLGGANLWLRLATPVEAVGVYGRRRRVSSIAFAVDEPERFVAALREEA